MAIKNKPYSLAYAECGLTEERFFQKRSESQRKTWLLDDLFLFLKGSHNAVSVLSVQIIKTDAFWGKSMHISFFTRFFFYFPTILPYFVCFGFVEMNILMYLVHKRFWYFSNNLYFINVEIYADSWCFRGKIIESNKVAQDNKKTKCSELLFSFIWILLFKKRGGKKRPVCFYSCV